ncbi:SGNH/GDSL hydrolase family protein [Crocosphaera sp. Alani8]|uniref:SGNH/GDSL hydrolase family protein n=1 Tax=Crocosphaera sp. Alani8 TaxID=3038952 RepID=UPI00313D81D9
MKKLSLFASFLTIFSLISPPAVAAGFSRIYGFGDSLSGTGNINQIVIEATNGTQTFPPSPPYFQGRFSNGPAWIEILAQRLDIPLINSAFGGATSGFENTLNGTSLGIPLPGLQQQITNFVNVTSVVDPHALYTIFIGANDYLPTGSMVFTPFENPVQTLTNIETALNSLVEAGAKNIMVFNLPNLGDIPLNNDSVDGFCPDDNQFDGDCLNDLTVNHNSGLSSLLSNFSSTSNINLIPIDINTLVDDAIENPFPSFTNVTDACLNFDPFNICNNPNEFLFWDDRHPTAEGHQLIADLAFESLAIPEPSTIVGLLSIGLIGIVKVIKQ